MKPGPEVNNSDCRQASTIQETVRSISKIKGSLQTRQLTDEAAYRQGSLQTHQSRLKSAFGKFYDRDLDNKMLSWFVKGRKHCRKNACGLFIFVVAMFATLISLLTDQRNTFYYLIFIFLCISFL